MSGPTFKLGFFFYYFFFNTQQNKHVWKQGLLVASQMFRGHISFVVVFVFFFLPGLCSSVLLGLELLLPGLVQVNQSLIVENKENEVQRICGDADDAEVL